MSTLYLVGTPIGNLEDISPRAIDTLKAVSLIAAEDTRTAYKLLNHFDIHTPVTSFFEHSQLAKLGRILDTLEAGDVAVISEAGMPGVNDPGYELVQAALARGHRVDPVPGPSAVLAALVGSGLPAGAFYYLGFLPREPPARRKLLREIAKEPDTLVAFETPHRLRAALVDMEAILGSSRRVCIARELTKVHEEFRRGTLGEVRAYFEVNEPRGEFTLVIEGETSSLRRTTSEVRQRTRRHRTPLTHDERWDDARVRREFKKLVQEGMSRTDAVKQVARAAKRERREVYELTLGGK